MQRVSSPSQLQTEQTHMLSLTGAKSHICAQCNKSIKVARDLRTHMLIHSGMKLHKCDECGNSFRQAGHLKNHLLTHSGEKIHKHFFNLCAAERGDFEQEGDVL